MVVSPNHIKRFPVLSFPLGLKTGLIGINDCFSWYIDQAI
ncbi:hypothetical protein RINTHM_2540 [Richelia intracellularis HM01]|nr:hypothetical protein RINTHM_2540 [Richelia intracellularis HM01]